VVVGDVTFKKEDLGNTPPQILENVASLKEHIESMTKRIEEVQREHDQTLEDPIIRDRVARIKEGVADQPYSVNAISKNTVEALSSVLKAKGMEDAEIAEVMETAKREIALDVEDNVRKAVANRLTAWQRDQELEGSKRKGFEILQKLEALNPKMKLKETDFRKLFEVRDGKYVHPEMNSDIGRVFKYWADRIGDWKRFAQMDPAEVYAAAAAKFGLPVALNTKDRDARIVAGERNRILEALGGKKIAKAMSTGKDGQASRAKKGSVDDDGAIDKERLNDPEYQAQLLDSAKTEEEIFEVQKMIKARLAA
jgi:hypothetical protein